MSEYYKKLYYGQVENNQIMSKEIKRLENNNKALKKMIQRDRDEVLQEMESINNQYLTELFIQQNKINKAIEEINYMITNADITEISAIKLKQILGDKENE